MRDISKNNTAHSTHSPSDEVKLLQYSVNKLIELVQPIPYIKAQCEAIDYKTLAMMHLMEKKFPGFLDEMEEEVNNQRYLAFMEQSDADDKEKGLVVSDTVTTSSWVIFSMENMDIPERSVFMAKIKMDDDSFVFPNLQKEMLGEKVGTVKSIIHDNNKCEINIRGARN
jgi:hypothetical protein